MEGCQALKRLEGSKWLSDLEGPLKVVRRRLKGPCKAFKKPLEGLIKGLRQTFGRPKPILNPFKGLSEASFNGL